MLQTKGIFLLLGSNMGDRLQNFETACEILINAKIRILARSSLFETEAWGIEDQPSFYNAVLEIETDLSPEQLLNRCLKTEEDMGRVRVKKWTERNIDIDILYYDQLEIESHDLKIPHPGIPQRRFTLTPLVELNPTFLHPSLQLSQEQLLAICSDPLECKKLNTEWRP